MGRKRSTEKITYDVLLSHVIDGVKCGIPMCKTIKKYKWHTNEFHKLTTDETRRYIEELKCLKKSRRGKNYSSIKKSDTADFNIIELF